MLSAEPSSTPVAYLVHEQALAARNSMRHAERTLAVLLARIHAEKLHHDLGYAHVLDYAVHALDLTPRKAEGLLRLGRSLPGLPLLDQAWASGDLAWTKARDMLGILTPDNEAAWVARAQGVTNRQLEDDLRTTLTGELPPSHVGEKKTPVRTRLVFDMRTSDAEIVNTMIQTARSQLGTDADDVGRGEILAALLQRTMHDVPREAAPTGERHRVVVVQCPDCRATSGERCEVDDTTVLLASCDAEILDHRDGPTRGHLAHHIPPATRRAVLQRDGTSCRVPDCCNRLYVDVHHIEFRSDGGDHDEENLVTLCGIHHTLVHDGRLSVERRQRELVFTFPRGRSEVRPIVPRPH